MPDNFSDLNVKDKVIVVDGACGRRIEHAGVVARKNKNSLVIRSPIFGSYVVAFGFDGWGRGEKGSYALFHKPWLERWTEERGAVIMERYRRCEIAGRLERMKWDTLSTETLEAINTLLTPKEGEKS